MQKILGKGRVTSLSKKERMVTGEAKTIESPLQTCTICFGKLVLLEPKRAIYKCQDCNRLYILRTKQGNGCSEPIYKCTVCNKEPKKIYIITNKHGLCRKHATKLMLNRREKNMADKSIAEMTQEELRKHLDNLRKQRIEGRKSRAVNKRKRRKSGKPRKRTKKPSKDAKPLQPKKEK